MAPRRGGSSFVTYYDSSPWSETTVLNLDYGYYGYGYNHSNYRTLFVTRTVFDGLSLVALIVFLVWSCTIRNRGLPLKGLIWALFSFILSQICMIVWEALTIAGTEVTMYYLIDLMLVSFFNLLGICLTFYVFWSLLHRMLGRLTDSGQPYKAVTILHWTLQGLIVMLSLADWALYVAYTASTVTSYNSKLGNPWIRLESALYIIFWLLSIEVLACSIFVVVKAGNHRFVSRMPAISLINAAVGWFAASLTWAVIYIRYNLVSDVAAPNYLYTAQAIVQFIFWVVTFAGILLCCSKWSKLGEEPEKYAAPAQYPYPQYPPAQYPPGQFPGLDLPAHHQAPYSNQLPQGQYPPTQQQPYGSAPYHDYSAQRPQTHQPETQQPTQHREAPSPL